MKMSLKTPKKSQTDIISTLAVPITVETGMKVRKLKAKYGKEVNKKIRDFIEDLIRENGL